MARYDIKSQDETLISSYMFNKKENITKEEIAVASLSSKEGIEMLFPDFQEGKEKIVFLCAHDDDALAGSAIQIYHLTKDWGAEVFPLILTDARNGYDPIKITLDEPLFVRGILSDKDYYELYEPLHKKGGDIFNQKLKEKLNSLEGGQRKNWINRVFENISHIRNAEAIAGYKEVGVPESNIIYYKVNGQTIQDLNIEPHLGMELLNGQDGIYKWLIKELRHIGATRFLTISGGDMHIDHQLVSKIGYNISNRAKSNLLHLGDPAPLKNNAEGTHGHFYVIYETLPEGEGEKYNLFGQINFIPKYTIMGTEEDVKIKAASLDAFTSQPRLVPAWQSMPDERMEFIQPFPSADRLIKHNDNYGKPLKDRLNQIEIKDIAKKLIDNYIKCDTDYKGDNEV